MKAHQRRLGDGPLLQSVYGEVTANGQMVEQHRRLGGEVPKDGATTDPRSLCDLIDRGLGVSLSHEQFPSAASAMRARISRVFRSRIGVSPTRPDGSRFLPGRNRWQPQPTTVRAEADPRSRALLPKPNLHPVADFLNRLMGLWAEPIGPDDEAWAAFGSVYADPVTINGDDVPLADLIARVRTVQGALGDITAEIVEEITTPRGIVVGFYLRGRHIGPWVGPLGTVQPTGRLVSVRTTDILRVEAGLVTAIWVVADELGLLLQLDAVTRHTADAHLLDEASVTSLQRHWEDGWNRCDLEMVMEPMSENVSFSSPFVATLTGNPARTTIAGYEALRSYISDSLRRSAGITYTLENTYVGTDSVILAYRFRLPDGTEKKGSDIMRLDGTRKIIEWRCHYPFDPDDARTFIAD